MNNKYIEHQNHAETLLKKETMDHSKMDHKAMQKWKPGNGNWNGRAQPSRYDDC